MNIEPEYQITVMQGLMVLPRLKYKLRRLPAGKGEIVGDFMTMSGEYRDLLANVHLLGGDVEFEDVA